MAYDLTFKYISFSEVLEKDKKLITLSCYAQEIYKYLQQNNIPCNPNVRKPAENAITKSIEVGIKKANLSQKVYDIPSSIYLAAIEIKEGNGFIFIKFGEEGGVLDGAHRLLAIKLAGLHHVKLDKTILNFQVYVNYPLTEIKELSLKLNLSKTPNHTSINHYKGEYDEIKEIANKYGLKFTYFTNENCFGGNDLTLIQRNIVLIQSLNPLYNPDNSTLNATNPKRHPNSLGRKTTSKNQSIRVSQYEDKDVTKLFVDAIKLQTMIANQLDKLVTNKSFKYVEFKRVTTLPTKTVLGNDYVNFSFPPNIYILPLVSAFRACLNPNEPKWLIEDDTEFMKFAKVAIHKMLKQYLVFFGQVKYRERSSTSLMDDYEIWNALYTIVKIEATESGLVMPQLIKSSKAKSEEKTTRKVIVNNAKPTLVQPYIYNETDF